MQGLQPVILELAPKLLPKVPEMQGLHPIKGRSGNPCHPDGQTAHSVV